MTKDREPDEATASALEEARAIMQRVIDGYIYDEEKIAAAIADASAKFEQAAAQAREAGDTRVFAEICDDLGTMIHFGGMDPVSAKAWFVQAAAAYDALGEWRDRLSIMLDISEIDPFDPAVQKTVEQAIAHGLPEDLLGEEDPLRLFAKFRDGQKTERAMALLDALDAEAAMRDDKVRMSKLFNERAKTQDIWLKDKAGALASAEKALELAADAQDKEAELSSLLTLVDLHWSRGAREVSRELFRRAEKIRGVPKSLRTLRKIMALNFK